jgi:hypothetical protein
LPLFILFDHTLLKLTMPILYLLGNHNRLILSLVNTTLLNALKNPTELYVIVIRFHLHKENVGFIDFNSRYVF